MELDKEARGQKLSNSTALSEANPGSAPVPDITIKCYLSQDNIDRAKAHPSYCLYALPIKEALLHEHNIPPGKSQVDVNKLGEAWITWNGIRWVGPIPDYKMAQDLDAAAESGSIEELTKMKAAIKPHAFSITFKAHHHLHVPVQKSPPELVAQSQPEGATETTPPAKPMERAIQAVQAQPESTNYAISKEIHVSPATVKRAREKLKEGPKPEKSKSLSVPKSPEQRIAHRARPFLPT